MTLWEKLYYRKFAESYQFPTKKTAKVLLVSLARSTNSEHVPVFIWDLDVYCLLFRFLFELWRVSVIADVALMEAFQFSLIRTFYFTFSTKPNFSYSTNCSSTHSKTKLQHSAIVFTAFYDFLC